MSRNKGKKKGQATAGKAVAEKAAPPQTMPTPAQTTPAPPQPTPAPSPWPLRISILALAISVLSPLIAYRQMSIHKENLNRTSGKVQSKFAFIEVKNMNPHTIMSFKKKEVGTDKDIFRIDSVEDMLRWSPHVVIKNIGEEVIDSVKIEVDLVGPNRAYGFGVKQIEPKPIIYADTSVCEVFSFGKLLPNHQAAFFVAPVLLDQMVQIRRLGPFPDADREDAYRIRVLCRLAGVQGYDPTTKSTELKFHWRQTGFDETKCSDVIKQKPKVILVEPEDGKQ